MNLWLPKGEGGKKGYSQEVWDGHVHTAIFKMYDQQGPTVQHMKLLHVLWQPGWEGSFGENGYMYICG